MHSYNSHTDEVLLKLLKAGDECAFNEIYRRYWKLLFSVAGNKLNNLSDAEEAVEDIFVDLWKRRDSINITHSLKSFLAGAIRFRVYTILAGYYRQRVQKELLTYKSINTMEPSVEEAQHFNYLQNQILLAVTKLPERCRLVYQLSRDEGYSNKQIAHTLKISEKTVETQITRALRQLRIAVQNFMTLMF